jgi:ATP-dependent helicase/nuclease subunit B
MSDGPRRPSIFTIPSHRSFADALAAGLIQRFGKNPLGLARGRILLPNNRAVRAVTDAFVRASGSGLLLPRLIPVGDPELDERIGGALDRIDEEPLPPAIDSTERVLTLASFVPASQGSAEALRLAADLGRTLDALLAEEIDPARLRTAVGEASDLAGHWELSLARLQLIVEQWPAILADRGAIDLAGRRNVLLRQIAEQWKHDPPDGFTVAAGITTSAPAVAALVSQVARMESGLVILPGLWLSDLFPREEWDALGPDDQGRGEATHPQFHLKLLLDRMGIAREEVELWRYPGGAASSPARARAVANAMAAPDFSHKWETLAPAQRRLGGVRLAELPDAATEAQAIALALREVLETSGKTAALVTPDRQLAARVVALLQRWNVEADDSAGQPLSKTAPGTLLLGIAAAAAERMAPVALLALLKHPLVGGVGEERLNWLQNVRALDLALRGPRPPEGIVGLDAFFAERAARHWQTVRGRVAEVDGLLNDPISLSALAKALSQLAQALAGDSAWIGPAGRMAAELLSELQSWSAVGGLEVNADDAVPLLRQLLDECTVRPPYGGHPRIFVWGLLEARLQRADLVVLGGLNEGVWPGLPAPDPWLPPMVRANLGMPTLDTRIGLSAHDFASALGAPNVLITRAKRDNRSPTVASRFLLRLNAMTGGLPRDVGLERLTRALDDPGPAQPVDRPAPAPPAAQRPERISVTQVDRLMADPFAFYAQAILRLRAEDPVDADHTARWKGDAVHKTLEEWLRQDQCDPDKLRPRAEALLKDEAIHPMLRALWAPRLLEAIDWIAAMERQNQSEGRQPLQAEVTGETAFAGVTIQGRADRIDRFADGSLAIIDYKTGAPPTQKAVNEGFALQLGLLGLIGRAGGFEGVSGDPEAFEYWSLARYRGKFGRLMRPDKDMPSGEFLDHAYRNFVEAAARWLTGNEPFTAKLNPVYAPYGDYDQLMRLEEWYGRK